MTQPLPITAVLAGLLLSAPAAGAEPAPRLPDGDGPLYLGHSIVEGERVVPILGRLLTRTETWVLARIAERDDGSVVVDQIPCAMDVKPVAGVRVQLDPDAVPRLPAARFELQPGPDRSGALEAPAWTTGWGTEDVDGDGLPGVSIDVRAALCGGALQVASDTSSRAQGAWRDDELAGALQVEVEQRILDAQGACLRMVAKDSEERMDGRFRYAPAPAGATCASVPLEAWPDAAPEGS